MLFDFPIRGIMPIVNTPTAGIDNDEEHHEVIIKRQMKDDKNKSTSKSFVSIPIGSTVNGSMGRWGPVDPLCIRRERQSESS